MITVLVGVKWLLVVLSCMSLMMVLEHLLMGPLTASLSASEQCLITSFVHFCNGLFLFFKGSLYSLHLTP